VRAQRKLRRVNEDDPITRQMGDDRQVSQAETGSLASATFSSLDEMQRWVFRRILNEGAPASPRDLPTLELPPIQLVLTNPRRRVLTSVSRKWRLPLAVGEFCWHLSASNELSFIRYYSERWSEFADDEQTIRGSCYGYRLFRGAEGSPSQWETAHKLLRQDPSTRRAVLLMSQPLLDRDITAKDVACATSLQFLLRDGQLDAVLHMRSNDAFWGLPYDVFLFTMLQELFAAELNVEPGRYYHSIGSLHLYQRHVRTAKTVLDDSNWGDFEMPRLSNPEALPQFLSAERALRLGDPSAPRLLETLPQYWRQLAEILGYYRLGQRSVDSMNSIVHSPYNAVLVCLGGGKVLALR
jgi:thymidylate synthase